MVRTRFAPSPTGALHLGNARVAVLNWLFARHHGGEFVLRIEDTDTTRDVEGAEQGILDDLRWLGLEWDEGPSPRGAAPLGARGPYRQSERLALYRSFGERLRRAGVAYECFCTPEEIEERRRAAIAAGARPHYDGRCSRLEPAEARRLRAAGGQPALRFHVDPEGEVVVDDVVRGRVHFDRAEIGDFILLRSDGLPTYNFAVVVDDVLMEITHVIRGVGHLSNSPRQVVLYQALDQAPPTFAHVPTVLGEDRQKLSKRHGARAIAEYRDLGYHPDALINYLSLLSWSSPTGDELLTRHRLIEEVSLDRIGVADVVFDPLKLRWLSAKHIESMPLDALVRSVEPHIDFDRYPVPLDLLPTAVAAVRTHLATFSDVNEQLAGFFPAPARAPLEPDPSAVRAIEAVHARLSAAEWSEPGIQAALSLAATDAGLKGRSFYEPLRLALTGRQHGPPFVVILLVQGRERVLTAVADALQHLRAARALD